MSRPTTGYESLTDTELERLVYMHAQDPVVLEVLSRWQDGSRPRATTDQTYDLKDRTVFRFGAALLRNMVWKEM